MKLERPHAQLCVQLVAALSLISLLCQPASGRELNLRSPSDTVEMVLSAESNRPLTFKVSHGGKIVVEPSPLGISIDGQALGSGVSVGSPKRNRVQERYAWRGVKSEAVNNCIVFEIPITHLSTGTNWMLEARVFDDGVAYRYRVPGKGRRRVGGEASSWHLPAGTQVWYQTNTDNYEGVYSRSRPELIPTEKVVNQKKRPLFLGCPVTAELPEGGYALLTEAGLYGYSGMTLRPTPTGTLLVVFEDDPNGFELTGEIVSPWRVTVITTNLHDLVNSDLIFNLCEPPDPKLFPNGINTGWIRPGKGLITWAVFGNDGAQWFRQKWFVDMCAALNCEYLLVDGGWRSERWGFRKDGGDEWARLEQLVAYAAKRKVGIFVWHAYPEGRDDGPGLTDQAARRAFLKKCREVGVKGVKIDFFDSERKEIINVYEELLRLTAENQLMVNFHGANKPTGETRTRPHEITREGIREQEYLLWDSLPLEHYGALPFTRMVSGYGDFLPTFVRPEYLKNTTAVFQLATAVIFTSPFICWPDHPEAYLESPFLPVIRTMPAVWDETRVLEGSTIGKFVAFARRSGEDWYLAVLNCQNANKIHSIDLSFLGSGEYVSTLYYDSGSTPAGIRVESGSRMQRGQTISVELTGGGGFVAILHRPSEYTQ